MLTTNQLTYKYQKRDKLVFPDFTNHQGQNLLITGPSGCGKSTLLHLLAGLLSPTSGELRWFGEAYHHLKGAERDRFRIGKLSIIFQKHFLIKALNVQENIALAARMSPQGLNNEDQKTLMHELKIDSIIHQMPHEISSGQAQRVAIARALASNPKLLLADEPSAHLDDQNTHQLITLLQKKTEEMNTSMIIVTHDERLKKHFPHQIALS